MIKAFALLTPKPGHSREQFQSHWREIHATLVQRVPGLRRFVQSHQLPATYRDGEPEPLFDGVAELWWRDRAAFDSYWGAPTLRDEFSGDTPQFMNVESSVGLLAEEVRVVWP